MLLFVYVHVDGDVHVCVNVSFNVIVNVQIVANLSKGENWALLCLNRTYE